MWNVFFMNLGRLEDPIIGDLYVVDGGSKDLNNRTPVADVALSRVKSNSSLPSINFNCAVAQGSILCSRAYAVFASVFTSCKEAVFGPLRWEVGQVYSPEGTRQYARCYNEYNCDTRGAEPTYYERFVSYVYSAYERLVRFFCDLFGIED